MGQEDLETVRINVYAALSIGAIGFPLSVAAFYSNVRRYNRSAASQPGGKWTRFQTIMMYALLLQIVGAGLSIVTLIATWMFNPSRLAIPVACATVDFNSGSRNVGIWVLELGWQLCLQAGGFTYFYIVMNRYSVFRMHIPGGTSVALRTALSTIGFVLYLLTLAQHFLKNIGVAADQFNINHPQCTASLVFEIAMLCYAANIDLFVAIHLCRAAFGLDSTAGFRSWSILKRSSSSDGTSIGSGHSLANRKMSIATPLTRNTTHTSSPVRINSPISDQSSPSRYPPPRPTHARRTLRQELFLNRHRRRVVYLLFFAMLMQALGLCAYIFPFFMQPMKVATRASEVISMILLVAHFQAGLWFLESFKEVVMAPRSAMSLGEYVSSIAIEPEEHWRVQPSVGLTS